MKALAAAVLTVILMLGGIMLGGGSASAGGADSIDGVPEEYVSYVLKAGAICPEITPSVVASVIDIETGGTWNPNAHNPKSGADGMGQFLPSTWAGVGKDGDGDGKADIRNPADAIFSSGSYLCGLVETVRGYLKAGKVKGDILDLAVASYNAGSGNVLKYGGVPTYAETTNYLVELRKRMARFTVHSGGGVGAAASAGNLVAGSTYANAPAPEGMTMPDPTPGAHGRAAITPRMYRLIQDIRKNYPQIANSPALYCWDAHTFNPSSYHPRGRACDIPFYGCTLPGKGNPTRAADPRTGRAAGNAAANWIISNAEHYGVQYIIWQGKIWHAKSGWTAYLGSAGSNPSNCGGGHYDHIHVNVW